MLLIVYKILLKMKLLHIK